MILHALIANGSRILVDASPPSSSFQPTRDFSHATSTILSKIPPNDSRLTYAADSFLFHYIKKDGLVFMCMAEEGLGRKVPFAFLAGLQRRFTSDYTPVDVASLPPYGLQSAFEPTFVQMIVDTNASPVPPDPLKQAKDDLANVKDIMVQNVEQILSRGERIELLVDKTDAMSAQAGAFRRRSQALRRRMWWKNTKMMILIAATIVVIIYILIAQACGVGLNHCSS